MFDLYFAGSQNKIAEEYMKNNNCNRLLSYYSDKSIIRQWVEFKKNNNAAKNKLFIDCGAYTAYTQGVTIDIDQYISYINEIIDYIDIFASLDIINGSGVEDSDEQTYKNYLYIKERVRDKHKLLPTYHQGDNVKYLKLYLQDLDIDYIALGGLVGSTRNNLDAFFQKCYKVIQEVRPDIKVHAFGMTSKPLLNSYPFTSADSTAWIMTGANGCIMSPWGIVNVSENQTASPDNYKNLPENVQKLLQEYVSSFGHTMEECQKDYKVRCLMNIKYLYDFSVHHIPKLKNIKKSLF